MTVWNYITWGDSTVNYCKLKIVAHREASPESHYYKDDYPLSCKVIIVPIIVLFSAMPTNCLVVIGVNSDSGLF